jgi:hypothetical protein
MSHGGTLDRYELQSDGSLVKKVWYCHYTKQWPWDRKHKNRCRAKMAKQSRKRNRASR